MPINFDSPCCVRQDASLHMFVTWWTAAAAAVSKLPVQARGNRQRQGLQRDKNSKCKYRFKHLWAPHPLRAREDGIQGDEGELSNTPRSSIMVIVKNSQSTLRPVWSHSGHTRNLRALFGFLNQGIRRRQRRTQGRRGWSWEPRRQSRIFATGCFGGNVLSKEQRSGSEERGLRYPWGKTSESHRIANAGC